MVLLGNRCPWCWRRCSHMFRWAERQGRHSLPVLGRHLGVRVRSGLHFHLNSFLHMLWLVAGNCTQYEIPFHFPPNKSGIWNLFNEWLLISYVILLHIFILTSSIIGSGWIGFEQGSHCHTVCPGEVNHQKGLLWSLDNNNHMHHTSCLCIFAYPCWENSAGWQSRFVVRWCRCNLVILGSCLDRMVRWGCHLGLWNCLHMHQIYRSIGTHLWIHMQAEIQGHSQNSWIRIWGITIYKM